jgi:threonyl-tRNA synthetase
MERHDHRSLAKQIDLYHIEEEAPGMVFWHPNGFEIYRQLEDFIRARMRRLGYREVRTPPAAAARHLGEERSPGQVRREHVCRTRPERRGSRHGGDNSPRINPGASSSFIASCAG